ncbi:MAG: hypothetical protein IJX49_02490 [Clostridia bacterium]|nr:hypothetical protein [Clostridia bacterium]
MKAFNLRMRSIILALQFLLPIVLGIGCSGTTTTTQIKALSPPQNLLLIGDVLLWDEVENAVGYQIYANDAIVAETKDNSYMLTHKNAMDETIKCKALGDNVAYKDSFFSFEITRMAYVEPVLAEYDLNTGTSIEVAADITYAKIVGDVGKSYSDFTLKILSREKDLKIELVNVNAVAQYCSSAIYSEEYKNSNVCKGYNVYLISEGEGNSIQGGLGRRGADGADGSFMVSGGDGGTGGTGGSAVTVENLIICGSADLSLLGGKGGKGGTGGDGGEFIVGSGSTAGSGGKGGTGGDGITAKSIYFYGDEDMTLTVTGGNGGEGGECGGNSALGEGIVYGDGTAGGIGKKHNAKLVVLKGIYR